MTTKHTLMSLCQEYNKIEIPIIQRDYAQGRENQNLVRNRFVEFLIQSLVSRVPIELDFVYGNIRKENYKENHIRTFIPIDGQQRLTTLWLLHWFLAIKENRLEEIAPWMNRFSYETRPSSHSFCSRLMKESFPATEIYNIAEYIVNQKWFDNEWNNDGTISGMLCMLREFCKQKDLLNGTVTLDYLLSGAISFYFVPLELFGLSDELYIRMNARGKVLTDFENFKSEFYKILKSYPRLEDVKEKIEQRWVEILWPYRKKNVYVIDNCFMSYLRFITRMLYFRQAKPRAEHYQEDFLDTKLLRDIYTDNENTDFLLFALDIIPILKKYDKNNLLWEKNRATSLADLLDIAIRGEKLTIDMMMILYAGLRFLYNHGETQKLLDFVRVIRNLIYNTNDKSERDQPRIIRSIDKFSQYADVYEPVAKESFNLEGLRDSQCKEEHFKVLLQIHEPKVKNLIGIIEDNPMLRGNINNLLAATYVKTADEIANFELNDEYVKSFNPHCLEKLYAHYLKVSENDFALVWGDLLNSMLYTHNRFTGRMYFDDDSHCKNPAIIALTVSYMNSNEKDLEAFLITTEKEEICYMKKSHPDLGDIRDVKCQLYIYYVITRRVMGLGFQDFFKNGKRIGWLSKENGFSSLFHNGIKDDPWFDETGQNPIFQTYVTQFRYNWGLTDKHALPPEIEEEEKPHNIFDKLLEWANS